MEIKITTQTVDLAQIQSRGAQAVATEANPVTPTRVTTMPVAQEAIPVTSYYNRPMLEVATQGDITPPIDVVLSHFDVDASGTWSDEERLAARLQLNMKNNCFDGDIVAMSTWLSNHEFTSPMSLDDASDALEMYLAESTA